MKKLIHIQEYLPSTITSRKSVEIINDASPWSHHISIVFDFNHIDFISRAFADELIHFIEEKNISAEFQNTNPIVSEMLSVVKKNRNKRNSTFHNIAVTKFIDKKEFSNFLSLI